MNSKMAPSSVTALVLGASALMLSLSVVSCGSDSGSGPDSSNSSPSTGSSSSVYEPPKTDPDAPVIIANFSSADVAGVIRLQGDIYIDEKKNTEVRTIDSVVFGANPAGPKVIFKTVTPVDEMDLDFDLNARIVLDDFEGCGEFTVYVTAYALGKPVTDSLTFTKPASYCAVSSSSSEVPPIAISSAAFTLGAQGNGTAFVALDLDSKTAYTKQDVSANLDKIDLLFGCTRTQCYLLTPADVSAIGDYADFASSGYKGKIYETDISGNVAPTDGALIAAQIKATNNPAAAYEVYSRSSYAVVTSDDYDLETLKNVYLIQFPQVIPVSTTTTVNVVVWSAAP